jgi:hypothetical protein
LIAPECGFTVPVLSFGLPVGEVFIAGSVLLVMPLPGVPLPMVPLVPRPELDPLLEPFRLDPTVPEPDEPLDKPLLDPAAPPPPCANAKEVVSASIVPSPIVTRFMMLSSA